MFERRTDYEYYCDYLHLNPKKRRKHLVFLQQLQDRWLPLLEQAEKAVAGKRATQKYTIPPGASCAEPEPYAFGHMHNRFAELKDERTEIELAVARKAAAAYNKRRQQTVQQGPPQNIHDENALKSKQNFLMKLATVETEEARRDMNQAMSIGILTTAHVELSAALASHFNVYLEELPGSTMGDRFFSCRNHGKLRRSARLLSGRNVSALWN